MPVIQRKDFIMKEYKNSTSGSGTLALYAAAGIGLYAAAKRIYREMNKFDFADKVVIITGGARGLGLIIARELAAKGALLVICSRNSEQLESAENELTERGANVLAVTADISDPNDALKVIQTAVSHFGRLDVLINNAGIMLVGPQNVMDIQDYKKAMDTNFWASLYMIKAALPYFAEQGAGRIVNVCSIGGKISVPHLLPYSVSKFAMVALSEGLHAELKKDNIHVTTVIPNLMRTGSPRNILLKGKHESEFAWFKYAGSSPLLSQDPEESARKIIKATEYGLNEVTLTLTAKLAVAVQGIKPGLMSGIFALANKFLPDSGTEGHNTKKGYESESDKTSGPVPSQSDIAAILNNEI